MFTNKPGALAVPFVDSPTTSRLAREALAQVGIPNARGKDNREP